MANQIALVGYSQVESEPSSILKPDQDPDLGLDSDSDSGSESDSGLT
jgi:hypothetical protein